MYSVLQNKENIKFKFDKFPYVIIDDALPKDIYKKLSGSFPEPEKNNNSKNLILVGQYIQATIFGMEMDNIFLLPRNNVRNESVWVVNSQMELTNRAVDIVRFEGEFALIGEGIEKGDRLLKSRLSSLINGQKVTYTLK